MQGTIISITFHSVSATIITANTWVLVLYVLWLDKIIELILKLLLPSINRLESSLCNIQPLQILIAFE